MWISIYLKHYEIKYWTSTCIYLGCNWDKPGKAVSSFEIDKQKYWLRDAISWLKLSRIVHVYVVRKLTFSHGQWYYYISLALLFSSSHLHVFCYLFLCTVKTIHHIEIVLFPFMYLKCPRCKCVLDLQIQCSNAEYIPFNLTFVIVDVHVKGWWNIFVILWKLCHWKFCTCTLWMYKFMVFIKL